MSILLKLDYAKFGVFNLFFSKVIREKPMGDCSTPPPPVGKRRVNPIEPGLFLHLPGPKGNSEAPMPKIKVDVNQLQ